MYTWLVINMFEIYLMCVLLCFSELFLEEWVLLQKSHGIDIPSKWLASMWFLMWIVKPSLPHTLQMDDVSCFGLPCACFPWGIIFWHFSIIDFTISSSACRVGPEWFGIATVLKDFVRALSGIRSVLSMFDDDNNSAHIFAGSDCFRSSWSSNSSLEVCPSARSLEQ